MWTCESYLSYAKKHRKKFKKNFPTSSKPKKLFVVKNDKKNYYHYIFSLDNWNDCDLVRNIIVSKMEEKGKSYLCLTKNDTNVEIFFSNSGDYRHTTIIAKKDNYHHTYEVFWYKHRGKTDKITYDGEIINLIDYINLLNLLEK